VRPIAGVIAFALTLILGNSAGFAAEQLSHGRFKHVEIFRPPGEVKHFALFMSGDGGWSSKLAMIAGVLAQDGTLVAGVDTSELFESLEKDGGNCVSPDGDLENLSHYVQAYYKVPTYFTPILIGHSAGATLAYSSLAQAPAGIFGGALTLSFCVDLDLQKPLCQAQGLHYNLLKNGAGARLLPPPQLTAPWVALHGTADRVCPISEARHSSRRFVARGWWSCRMSRTTTRGAIGCRSSKPPSSRSYRRRYSSACRCRPPAWPICP
jgi:type IV secretory pathway VirJ component